MTDVAHIEDDIPGSWRAGLPQVRKALAFIQKKGIVTAEELKEWDRTHGQRLFDWNDKAASNDWRLHQARLFLNQFRGMFDGMRVRKFIHINKDEDEDIGADGYVSVERIAKHKGMRDQVVSDITRRMAMLASELRMWRLTSKEQAAIFEQLRAAMIGQAVEKAS